MKTSIFFILLLEQVVSWNSSHRVSVSSSGILKEIGFLEKSATTDNSATNTPAASTPTTAPVFPKRYDPEYPFPETCSPRFEIKLFSNGEKNQANKICKDAYRNLPVFPISAGHDEVEQEAMCRAMCIMDYQCLAYTFQWVKNDSTKLFVQKQTSCSLCSAPAASTGDYPSVNASANTLAISGYKNKIVFSDYGTQRTTTPCSTDDECAYELSGMNDRDVCEMPVDLTDPDAQVEEYISGDQATSNSSYQIACELHLINKIFSKNRWDFNCVNASMVGNRIDCQFTTGTRKQNAAALSSPNYSNSIKGSVVSSASLVYRPVCPIPYENATDDEKGINGLVDCRNRNIIHSRVTKESLEFDCASVISPSTDGAADTCSSIVIKDNIASAYCCDTPIANTHVAMQSRKFNYDKLKDEFQYETIAAWCPSVCDPKCYQEGALLEQKTVYKVEGERLDPETDVVSSLVMVTKKEADAKAKAAEQAAAIAADSTTSTDTSSTSGSNAAPSSGSTSSSSSSASTGNSSQSSTSTTSSTNGTTSSGTTASTSAAAKST